MIRRVVDTAFWTDVQVIDNYSVEDKYFMLYLLTNDKTSQVGIYSLPKKVMSFETGFTTDIIQVLIERFSNNYNKIVYSEKTQEVTILHSLKYSILKGGKPVSDLLERELANIKDSHLILKTYDAMKEFWITSKRNFDKTIMGIFEKELANRKMPVQNENDIQNDIHNDIQNDIYNDNQYDNDNEESWPTNRGTIRSQEETEAEEERLQQYINSVKQSTLYSGRMVTTENILEFYYEEMIGTISPEVTLQFKQWLTDYPKSIILEALHRSRNANIPLSYARTIINKWKEKGVNDYIDIIKLDREFNKSNNS